MDLLEIDYIGAVNTVATYTVGTLAEDVVFTQVLKDGDTGEGTITWTYDAGSKGAHDVSKKIFWGLRNGGYIIGRLNSDTEATTFRIVNLDKSREGIPSLSGNAQISDPSGTASNADDFHPISTEYSSGTKVYIPFSQIIRIERLVDSVDQVRLYYSTDKYIKFIAGNIDTAKIDKYYDAANASVQTITSTTFFNGSMYSLEQKLKKMVSKGKSGKFDWDTRNFTASIVSY